MHIYTCNWKHSEPHQKSLKLARAPPSPGVSSKNPPGLGDGRRLSLLPGLPPALHRGDRPEPSRMKFHGLKSRSPQTPGVCIWVWVKIKPGTAGFSPRFHLPGFHFVYLFLTRSQTSVYIYIYIYVYTALPIGMGDVRDPFSPCQVPR